MTTATATAPQAKTETETTTDRSAEILAAVDHLISEHDAWADDDTLDDYIPPASFDAAVDALAGVLISGEVPNHLAGLVHKALEFSNQWFAWIDRDNGDFGFGPDNEAYELKHDKNGHIAGRVPHHRTWRLLREVMDWRKKIAEKPEPKTLERVCDLIEQGVSPLQIARIFGKRDPENDRWSGPFFTAFGSVDESLIAEHAAYENGKGGKRILKDSDYVSTPPEDGWKTDTKSKLETVSGTYQEIEKLHLRQAAIDRAAMPAEPQIVDKGTPLSLAREGAFPHQVQAAFHLTAEQTAEVFRQLRDEKRIAEENELRQKLGIKSDGDETASQATESTPAKDGPEDSGLFDQTAGDEPEAVSEDSAAVDMRELQRLVGEIHNRDESLGAADIARRIEDETGHKIDGRTISMIIRRIREESTAAG